METVFFNVILGLCIFIVLFAIVDCMASYSASSRASKIFNNMFSTIWVHTLCFIFIAVVVYCVIITLKLIIISV